MEVLFGHRCQPHIPVDASEEGEIGGDGGDVLPGIVHTDGKCVGGIGVQVFRKVESRCRVASGVASRFLSVDVEGSGFAGCIQLQEDLFPLPALGQVQGAAVPSGAPVVLLFGIGVRVPGVRQVYVCPLSVIEGAVCCGGTFSLRELPAVVQAMGFPLRHCRICVQEEA